jgi:hypothetical protein
MRKVEEIRQMREQTELLRQQTEALRQQNQQSQQPGQPVAIQPSLYGQPIDWGTLAGQSGGLPAPPPPESHTFDASVKPTTDAPVLLRAPSLYSERPVLLRTQSPYSGQPLLDPKVSASAKSYLNGLAWKGFTARERIIYLQSLMEGMVSVGLTTNSMQQVHALFPGGLTPAQVAAKLDDFYSPGSEAITIVDALRILAKE